MSHRRKITDLLMKGNKNCWHSIFFSAVTKRTTNRQQTKNQLKIGRKRFRNRKAKLWPSKYVRLQFLQAAITYNVTSH